MVECRIGKVGMAGAEVSPASFASSVHHLIVAAVLVGGV
jgi:hypothetical protein